MTPLQLHLADWELCTKCDLHKTRTKVVQFRGSIPCDVLFTAEAPGHSEDAIGYPLVGPAGRLFDNIVSRAVPEGIRCGYCNLIACIPLDEMRIKTAEGGPPVESIQACSPRLIQLIQLANPKLIVCVGTKATEWLDVKWKMAVIHDAPDWVRKIPQESIVHPSAILQAPVAAQGLMKQKAMVTLSNAVEEYVTDRKEKKPPIKNPVTPPRRNSGLSKSQFEELDVEEGKEEQRRFNFHIAEGEED